MTSPTWVWPLRVSPVRAVGEAAAVYAGALSLDAALNSSRSAPGAFVSGSLVALGWLLLFAWPAWRIRPLRGRRWWRRIAMAAGRGFLIVLALGATAVILTLLAAVVASFWPVAGFGLAKSPVLVVLVAAGFGLARTAVVVGAWLAVWMRKRLRRQLMASHAAVILLTIAPLTALASVAAVGLVVRSTQPNGVEMARSVRDQLQLTSRPMAPEAAHRVFLAVIAGRLPQRGQPPASFVVGGVAVPQGLALLDPGGRVLTAVEAHRGTLPARHWSGLPGLDPAVWTDLRTAALHGRPLTVRVHFPGTASQEHSDLAEVPIQNSQGRTVGILLLTAGGLNVTSTQFFQVVILLFGASTVALIGLAGVPLLALSFLFAYLMARGLTRRLEDVSGVATAVAAGNFEERAPVSSQDEVGQLAEDVNRMAGRLELLVAELTRARSQAEVALQTRQELVANVSHELRTPLAVLHAHLESIAARDSVVIGGGKGDEVAVPIGTLEALRGETVRLAAMIDDLFALSRAETGSLPLERRPVDVGAVVDEVVRFMRPLARSESAVTLSADVAPGLPPVPADPGRLHQILSNLVRNAIRHTPEGGIVVLSARSEKDHVSIRVADTGEGIAPEDLPHLFERFYRADPSRTRETGGSGLGLAIVRELVELMGGSVSVESTPGEGSRFTVSLPVYA